MMVFDDFLVQFRLVWVASSLSLWPNILANILFIVILFFKI